MKSKNENTKNDKNNSERDECVLLVTVSVYGCVCVSEGAGVDVCAGVGVCDRQTHRYREMYRKRERID